MNATAEVIPTGLTANYVGYWSVKQGIKEAVQNIVYGAVKSKQPIKIHHDGRFGYVADDYVGFEKRHLYLGESEQRHDRDGLGNFGEGWKLFLLIAAREGLKHRVDTVGFSFHGQMVDTPHGVKTLHIIVEPNDREKGTQVTVECSEKDFKDAVSAFALTQGIDQRLLGENCILPDRLGELWVNGVLVEQGDNKNPLNLHFSYHLKDRDLVNRDRSQVNVGLVKSKIQRLWSGTENKELIREMVRLAKGGDQSDDVQMGPGFFIVNEDLWVQAIEEAYGRKRTALVLPSRNPNIDREALYRGFQLLSFPDGWSTSLQLMGFQTAAEAVKRTRTIEPVPIHAWEKAVLDKARRVVKKCLQLDSVNALPPIVVSDNLKEDNPEVVKTLGLYNLEDGKIYLHRSVLSREEKAITVLLHEAIHWKTNAGDGSREFEEGYEEVILNLLGYNRR